MPTQSFPGRAAVSVLASTLLTLTGLAEAGTPPLLTLEIDVEGSQTSFPIFGSGSGDSVAYMTAMPIAIAGMKSNFLTKSLRMIFHSE